jgi:hypothetical protein
MQFEIDLSKGKINKQIAYVRKFSGFKVHPFLSVLSFPVPYSHISLPLLIFPFGF